MIEFIDLNDIWQPPPRFDLRAIRQRLCSTGADWLPALFPHAKLAHDGRILRCADLTGRAPRKEGSCIIHLQGRWAGYGYDHATGECADPIDLIHYATGLANAALYEEAARLARIGPTIAHRRPAAGKTDPSPEIARILENCAPVASSVAETYLRSRGLSDPVCHDLMFNPDLTDYETCRGWPGLVAVVRDAAGKPTGGIHRTFLLDDGSAKAPPGKKMLGSVAGGSVRLAPIGPDGHIGIAEGIETALSAQAIFAVPTWAALSADGMRKWQWPSDVKCVTIFADAGQAGAHAAELLAARLSDAGIANKIVTPLHGDDFNDDLKHGAAAADYQAKAAAPPIPDAPPAPLNVEQFEVLAKGLTNPPDLMALSTLLGQLIKARLEPVAVRQVLSSLKRATGIAVSILERQMGELRRRLNSTGDVNKRPVRPPWASQLRRDLADIPERNEANVITALSNDEAFAGALVFDEFRQEVLVNRPLPWDFPSSITPRPWSDADDVRCAEWLQHHEINVTPIVVSRSVAAISRNTRIHPVREYLGSIIWDGIPRLETWVITYLGADNTKLNRAFGSLWLISAVARIMRPGAKVDHMLILEGPQGTKKSTALKVLAGEEWFTDELAEIGSKDAAQQLRGVWIVEIAELDAISRAEVSRIKAFLTRTTDRYRPPYERYVIDVPRQCVFAGSVNPDTYLRDETGNRRFWPLRCGAIDLEGLRRDRDQLWAEAALRYREGTIWWLEDRELIVKAKAEQDERYQSDAWDALIERWLVAEKRRVNRGFGGYDDWQDEESPRPTPLRDVTIGDVLHHAIGLEPGRWHRSDQMRVAAYLKRQGWERYRNRRGSDLEWRYRR